tara:strand:- start:606 stop:842 length:237 start_codon:yes stop_codon:yes gene_type:complete
MEAHKNKPPNVEAQHRQDAFKSAMKAKNLTPTRQLSSVWKFAGGEPLRKSREPERPAGFPKHNNRQPSPKRRRPTYKL